MAKNDNMMAILLMLNSGVKITAKQISEKLEKKWRDTLLVKHSVVRHQN